MHVQVDGSLFGQSTNIFSVYADPELRSTWQEYNLKDASLVVSCMLHRYQWPHPERLCALLPHRPSALPVQILSVSSMPKLARRFFDQDVS